MNSYEQELYIEKVIADPAGMGVNPEVVPFLLFEVDAGSARIVGGPNHGELMFPELGGKHTPLWNVTIVGGETLTTQRREDRATQKSAHQARVAHYAEVVASGGALEPLWEGEQDETPEDEGYDEWRHFWGGDSPTERMAMERVDD